jgi:O-antigen/teichoic acid export membrane protein
MGIGKIDIANYIFLAGRFIQVIVSVSLILAGIGVWGLYYGNVVFYLLIFCVYLYFIIFRYNIDLFKINGFRKNYMKELLSFGGTMFSARAVSMLIEPFNKVIISRYIGLAEISYYEIGLRGASQLRSLYEMGLKAIMPRVSELQQKVVDFKQVIADIYKKSLLFITIFAIPIFAGLFILADIALKLWLGNKYNTQIPLSLRWFLFGYIINLFAIPSYYIFMGIGKTGYCFLAHLITSVANILAVALIVAFNLTSLRLIISIHSFSVILSAIIMIYLFSVIKKDSFIRQSITNGKSEDAEENRQRTTL